MAFLKSHAANSPGMLQQVWEHVQGPPLVLGQPVPQQLKAQQQDQGGLVLGGAHLEHLLQGCGVEPLRHELCVSDGGLGQSLPAACIFERQPGQLLLWRHVQMQPLLKTKFGAFHRGTAASINQLAWILNDMQA